MLSFSFSFKSMIAVDILEYRRTLTSGDVMF